MPALPDRPSLEHLRKEAKQLLRASREKDPTRQLADAQYEIAQRYGFPTWTALKEHVAERNADADPMPALLAAVRASDADGVRRVLRRNGALRGSRLDAGIGDFGATLMITAAERADVAVIDALLERGASLDARSDWWAGSFGVLDLCTPAIATDLISRGATLDANAAARLGMLDALSALIDADPSRVHARAGDGQTPLHVASSVEIARLLVERGADVDALDVDHESTPAQYRVREHPDVARFLIERGARGDVLLYAALGDLDRVRAALDANPSHVAMAVTPEWFPMRNHRAGGTIYNWTLERNAGAHRIAHTFGHADVLALLFERSPVSLALASACDVGDAERVRAIRAGHPDITANLSARERIRLPFAAQNEDVAAVRLYLDAGWPIDARGHHLATALHWAAWHGHLDMTRVLLAHGAPVDVREAAFNGTPLGWAIHGSTNGWHPDRGEYGAVVAALLEAGSPVPPPPTDARADVRDAYDAWTRAHPA